jgi:DNA primase catalytic core
LSLINEIKDNIDIVDYVGQYVDLTNKGSNFVGLCPFHEDNDPSFKVSPSKNIFKCFGCGKGGNIFNFVTLYHKVDFGEAIRKLSEYLGFEADVDEYKDYYKCIYDFHQIFQAGWNEFAWDYVVNKRGIGSGIAEKFEIGFIPERSIMDMAYDDDLISKLGIVYKKKDEFYFKFPGCLTFPFFDSQDRPVGFSFMRIHRRDDEPKYENSWTTPVFKKRELFFGLKQAKEAIAKRGLVTLVEGYFDVLRLAEMGVDNVLAICTTKLSIEQAKIIKRLTDKVIIAFDGDEAGRIGSIESAFMLEKLGLNVSISNTPTGKDPDSYFRENPEKDITLHSVYGFFNGHYRGDDKLDVLLAHVAEIKDLNKVDRYFSDIKEHYSHLPTSLLVSRLAGKAESSNYKMKPSEFSIQKEILKAILQGHLNPKDFDYNKFSVEYEQVLRVLVTEYNKDGFIELDSWIMAQYSHLLEPLKISIDELETLTLPYKKFDSIEEQIKVKKRLLSKNQ